VLVGLPASESGNGLIMPLAGHEIGHNVWSSNDLNQHFLAFVSSVLVEEIVERRFKEFQELFGEIEKDQVDDLAGRPYWEPAFAWAMSQCEEMFCDFIGLLLFRESYLHAFEYLLAPGGGSRDANYPSTKSRVTHLVAAAKSKGIQVSATYADSFDDESSSAVGKEEFLLSISDVAREKMIDQLLTMAEAKLAGCKHNTSSPDEKKRVVAALTRGTPASGDIQLVNLVNAVWEIESNGIQIWKNEYPKLADNRGERSRILNELFLKSLEVLEIQQLQQAKP
jgi:hypothetical protein